jgi:hypothetical protein
MNRYRFYAVLSIVLVAAAAVVAQSRHVVTMMVTMPGGETKELSAPDSGLATVTLKDGMEVGFRPTMRDDSGTKTAVTIFRMNPSVQEMGEVDVSLKAPAVPSKTNPIFKIAIPKVS